MRLRRSVICLNGRCSVETASSLVSPITWVILKVKSLPSFFTNSIAARGYRIVSVRNELDIVEFIFVSAVILPEIFPIHFPQVVEIIRAFGIDALMDDKVFAFFLRNQGIAAVGAA